MEEKDYKTLDEAVYSVYCYLHSISKDTNEIVLKNFDRKNNNHLALFYIASMEKKIFNFELVVNCGLIDYFKIKWYFRDLVRIKYRRKAKNCVDCADMVKRIETIFYENVLADVYEAYYARKRR